jgi:hypothetical protein
LVEAEVALARPEAAGGETVLIAEFTDLRVLVAPFVVALAGDVVSLEALDEECKSGPVLEVVVAVEVEFLDVPLDSPLTPLVALFESVVAAGLDFLGALPGVDEVEVAVGGEGTVGGGAGTPPRLVRPATGSHQPPYSLKCFTCSASNSIFASIPIGSSLSHIPGFSIFDGEPFDWILLAVKVANQSGPVDRTVGVVEATLEDLLAVGLV